MLRRIILAILVATAPNIAMFVTLLVVRLGQCTIAKANMEAHACATDAACLSANQEILDEGIDLRAIAETARHADWFSLVCQFVNIH